MSVQADYCCFDDSDERLHQPGPEPVWNESMAFCFIDPKGPALFIRHGRRYNEGHIEVTLALHNQDGSLDVAFAKRPLDRQMIGDGKSSSAGGLTFTLVEPHKLWRATYEGPLRHIPHHSHFEADPGAALKAAKVSDGRMDLTFEDRGPLFSTGPNGSIPGGEHLSGRHYESSLYCTGRIDTEGTTREVAAYGFRDHSWGPRNMTRIDYTRWFWVQVDPVTSCVGWFTRDGKGVEHKAGVILRDGAFEVAASAEVSSVYSPAPERHAKLAHLVLRSPNGDIDVHIETGCPLPLRYTRDGLTTRGLEFAARVRETGLPAWAEYWDLIVEGVPAGNASV